VALYLLLRQLARSFYGGVGITPEEAGLIGVDVALQQAAVALVIFVGLIAVGCMAYLLLFFPASWSRACGEFSTCGKNSAGMFLSRPPFRFLELA
jgi:hypothetical protein